MEVPYQLYWVYVIGHWPRRYGLLLDADAERWNLFFLHWDISVICPIIILKPAIKAFNSSLYYFRTLWPNQGRNQRKISGGQSHFWQRLWRHRCAVNHDAIFCYDQLANIGRGTFFIVGKSWASAGGTKWAFASPANWHTNQIGYV